MKLSMSNKEETPRCGRSGWSLKGPCFAVLGVVFLQVGLVLRSLASEAVQSAALTFEGVDDIHGSDGLPLGMLSVGDCVPNDVLQENLNKSSTK